MATVLRKTEVSKRSPLHALNPITKIAGSLFICIAAFVSSNFFFLFALLALDVLIGIVGKTGKKTRNLLFGLANICVFLFILQALFVRSGTPVFWIITDEGLVVAGLVVLRLMIATIPLALLLENTDMNDLANALVKVLHVPYKYAFTITTAFRFIPIFSEEMGQIMQAQTARGIEFDTRNPVKKIGLMIPLCVPLLITTAGKTRQSAMAAETRGFYLRTRSSGYHAYPFIAADYVVLLFTLALAVCGFLI